MIRWIQVGTAAACLVLLLLYAEREWTQRSREPQSAETPVLETEEPELPALRKELNETDREKSDLLEVERAEARQILRRLLQENENFKKEVLDLQTEIRRLAHSLAQEKIRNDQLRLENRRIQSRATGNEPAAANVEPEYRVVDVNEALGMVVLNRGSTAGIMNRMRFAIVRDGQKIGALEAVSVRERIAGTKIIERQDGITIRPGDRVIPWSDG